MGRKRKGSRLYKKRGRWYAYLKDLGGGQEAMKPSGERYATKDRDVATALLAERIKELEAERRGLAILGRGREKTLGSYATYHLEAKAKAGKVRAAWLAAAETRFERAVEFFGAGKPIAGITVQDMNEYRDWLLKRPSGRRGGGTLSGGTVRHHINDLSNLYRRAQGEGVVPPGFNPVASMMEKPSAASAEARWLEPHEAALLLEAARAYVPKREEMAVPLYPLLATFLLTGGRKAEILGLTVGDVSFERRAVTFRPHPHRPLKTKTSHRSVPLWPQLESVLRDYLDGEDAPEGELLFPATHSRVVNGDGERMVTDVRRPLDIIAKRCGWAPGEIRTRIFRHTYTAARLQTLDRGAPVPTFTVSRELGHGGTSMVQRVYGHLGEVRHRAEVVEFRPDVIKAIGNAKTRQAFTTRLRKVRGLEVVA